MSVPDLSGALGTAVKVKGYDVPGILRFYGEHHVRPPLPSRGAGVAPLPSAGAHRASPACRGAGLAAGR